MFRNNNILNGLLALVFTFILGYIGLIFINKIFKDMVTTLDLKVKNEQARYKITEFILKEISSMEANYYKMFIFTDTKDLQNIEKEIKKRYKELAKKYHPDINNGDDEKMKELNHYRDILMKTVE
jgi:two-component system, NarL family, sensor histidine kinase BarA